MIYNFKDKVKQSLYAQGYEQKDIKYVRVKILSTIAEDYQDFDISYDPSGLEGALSQYVVECNICPSQAYGGGDGIHIERAYAPDKTKYYTYDKTKNIYTNNETGNALLASLLFGGGGNEIPSSVIQKTIKDLFCTGLPEEYDKSDVIIADCSFPIDYSQGAGYSTIDYSLGFYTIELKNPEKYLKPQTKAPQLVK